SYIISSKFILLNYFNQECIIISKVKKGVMEMSFKDSGKLESLLKPKTVAILGASANKNKLGYLQVKALLDGGFQGDIYPINPNADRIERSEEHTSELQS